jgi:hypothetical protein
MIRIGLLLMMLGCACLSPAQISTGNEFKLALPDHRGQMRWPMEGFNVIESSAKPNGREIGIRGRDESGRLNFLGFLFLVSEQGPMTSARCRDSALEPEKKSNPTLKVAETLENVHSGPPAVSVVTYTTQAHGSKTVHMVRGFVAVGDICGDLQFYSDSPIRADDADLRRIFANYTLDENYIPKFDDDFVYAQILYKAHLYKAAAPIFEMALTKLGEDSGADTKTMRRVTTDQAGMAYGMSGDVPKARAIFEKAVASDPEYPMYYYNLACADAEEKNLAGARINLQKAFDHKANVIAGENMPDPTTDDSFVPYHKDKEFWTFLEGLHSR